jgi:endonuclease VIII
VPEGDTIHRVAASLRPVLVGAAVRRFELPRHPRGSSRPAAAADLAVVAVDVLGKHLLIRFSDGRVLHTHLQMTGSWHLYRPGERWRKPAAAARAVIETDHAVAVCFSAPIVELLDEAGVRRHPMLSSRGPDLVDEGTDLDDVLARFRARAGSDTEVGVALLDQRIAGGIGNVYKSEVCHACGVDPFTPAVRLDTDTVHTLYATATRLLRANLATARRTTVGETAAGTGALAVYGRAGQACRRCGAEIRTRRQGEQARSTYWCPRCQT